LVAAALLALLGAPLAQEPTGAVFTVEASSGLSSVAESFEQEITQILTEAREWTGLSPSHEPFSLEWVASKDDLSHALGKETPSWFAAVAVPSERRLVIATEVAGSREQLRATLRHELMHLAMMDLGKDGFHRLPAWFHEGCAQLFAGDIYLRDFGASIGWLATSGDLDPLSTFRDGFPVEQHGAAIGYALGHAFVDRLVRQYGHVFLMEILAAVRTGQSLDEALIERTGSGVITHEEEMREELTAQWGWSGDLIMNLFLGLAVFSILSYPMVRSARKRRRRELEERWSIGDNEEDLDEA